MTQKTMDTIVLSEPTDTWCAYNNKYNKRAGAISKKSIFYIGDLPEFITMQQGMNNLIPLYTLHRHFTRATYYTKHSSVSCFNVPETFREYGITDIKIRVFFGDKIPTMRDLINGAMLRNYNGTLQDYLDKRFNVNHETAERLPANDPNYVNADTPAFCVKNGPRYRKRDVRPLPQNAVVHHCNGQIYAIIQNENTPVFTKSLEDFITAKQMTIVATPARVKAIFTPQHS